MIKGFLFSLLLLFLSITPTRAELVAHWPLDNDANDATIMAMMDKSLTELYCSKTLGHRTVPWPHPTMAELISYSPDLNPESFTVALWAKPTSTGGYTLQSLAGMT